MTEKLSVGDVVLLKSGSIPLVVVLVQEELNRVQIAWMHNGEISSTYAPVEALVRAEPA